jgi:hypothetical protein
VIGHTVKTSRTNEYNSIPYSAPFTADPKTLMISDRGIQRCRKIRLGVVPAKNLKQLRPCFDKEIIRAKGESRSNSLKQDESIFEA